MWQSLFRHVSTFSWPTVSGMGKEYKILKDEEFSIFNSFFNMTHIALFVLKLVICCDAFDPLFQGASLIEQFSRLCLLERPKGILRFNEPLPVNTPMLKWRECEKDGRERWQRGRTNSKHWCPPGLVCLTLCNYNWEPL